MCNDPNREEDDWYDIRQLMRAAGEQGAVLDWELLGDYLDLFGKLDRMPELKSLYGATD